LAGRALTGTALIGAALTGTALTGTALTGTALTGAALIGGGGGANEGCVNCGGRVGARCGTLFACIWRASGGRSKD
jgi:uncharacterized protein YjbI with pentapeptide repeats